MTDHELSAAIAEKVMGWRIITNEATGIECWADKDNNLIIRTSEYSPATDLSQASEALGTAMVANGWECAIKAGPDCIAFVELRHLETGLHATSFGRLVDRLARTICEAIMFLIGLQEKYLALEPVEGEASNA